MESELNTLRDQINALRDEVTELRKLILQVVSSQSDDAERETRVSQRGQIAPVGQKGSKALRDFIKGIVRNSGNTMRNLASNVALVESDLSGRLSGTSRTKLHCELIVKIIEQLMEWEAIVSLDQIQQIYSLSGCPEQVTDQMRVLDKRQILSASKKERLREQLTKNNEDVLSILSDLSQDDLDRFLIDRSEPSGLRLTLLALYLKEGYSNRRIFNELARDPSVDIRRTVARYIYKSPVPENPTKLDPAVIEELMVDSSSDVAAAGTRAAIEMIRQGKMDLSRLTLVKDHPYWMPRKQAIDCILQSRSPQMMDLLEAFQTTSYHVSQAAIRVYLEQRFDEGLMSDQELARATALVEALSQAPKVSLPSRNKDLWLLAKLRGESIDANIDELEE